MLHSIKVQNFRILQDVSIAPASGLNLIVGANGAGKTSLLEAIYVLVYGRSFRHREISPLIRETQNSFQLVSKFSDAKASEHRLGMQRTHKESIIRLDGRSLIRRSEILNLLPITWIGSDPQLLLTAGPEKRRLFLDTGLFHVEHGYLAQMQKYYRALEQRNAALKSAIDAINTWDAFLQDAGNAIDAWRTKYIVQLNEIVLEYLNGWNQQIELDMQYQRGWPLDRTLSEGLKNCLETDKKLKHTTIGIHRADLNIRSRNVKSGKSLSRGQLKMLASAFHFAQTQLFKKNTQTQTILLFDDLSAELDSDNRKKLLTTLSDLYDQSFVTSLNADDVCLIRQPDKMFHVEHGQIV